MPEFPTTWSGAREGMQLGINQQQADTQQQVAGQNFNTAQEHLKLQQQQQQNAQQRDLFARADKQRGELLGVVTETIQALKLHGADTYTIAKQINPLVQAAKRLAKSSGADDVAIDAQIAATLAQPGFDMNSVTGGRPNPAAPAPVVGDQSKNLTAPGTEITGIDYGPVQSMRNGQVVGTSPAPQNAQGDVDRFTRALITMPAGAPPGVREALKLRLQDSIERSKPDISVHFAKTEDGGEVPVFVDKLSRTVTDAQGNPFVSPSGDDSDKKRIADAIEAGRQPPVTTGLYRNAKGVKAELERRGFDVTRANLEWQAATKQVASLNGPQMTRYAGLATSVVNTIDEVLDLSKKMDLSGVPLANRAEIAAYMQTAGNTEGGQLAARYIGAITTLKEEFANLAQGGYAPTEAAFALANKQINENYGVKQTAASLMEVQRLIRYRLQGIPNFGTLGPSAPNRFTNPGASGGAAAVPVGRGGGVIPPPPEGAVIVQ